MDISKLVRSAAGLTALLAAALCALPCAAADSGLEDDDIILRDDDQTPTYTCGDYEYSIMVNTENDSERAACLQKYTGNETDIVIPSELDGLEVIALGDTVYTEHKNIQTVTIPKSVIAIGSYTFSECVSLEKYTVEEGNPYYSSTDDGWLLADGGTIFAWYPAYSRAESVTVPDGVTAIGDSAFSFAGYIKEITLPESVTKIGKAAFLNCSSLESVNIPSGVTAIPDYAFQFCTSLKSVALPDGLTEIGNAAFAACGLESITLPDSLLTIGQAAFAGTKFMEITIPPLVQEIGDSALGYKLSKSNEFIINTGFTIRGYAGSAAQQYCADPENGSGDLLFREIKSEDLEKDSTADDSSDSTDADSSADSQTAAQEETGSGLSAGRIAGIAVCIVLFIAIGVTAAVTGKKEKKKDA